MMQPLGRRSIQFPSKRDYHFKQNDENWWESIAPAKTKRARQNSKKEVKQEIDYYTSLVEAT